MKQIQITVEFKDHSNVILTNSQGDTYTSTSEELGDFLHGAKPLVSGALPADLKRKIEIHIETTEECVENFGIPKYVKELLEQDIELYRKILARC